MKKFFSVLAVLLCAISLVIFSCGGGGGGAGGATAGTSSGSSSGAGGSAVSIRFNGLYARSAGTVWDTIDYLDLKIFVDDAEVFSKRLTASDNVVLVEHLTPGSTARATGSFKFNEMNGSEEGNITSDTITLERGSNTLTLNVYYKYTLIYCDTNMTEKEYSGTYTVAGGIPLPPDFSDTYNTDIFTGWMLNEMDVYPKSFAGVRGNVMLRARYEYIPATFNVTYHFERDGVPISGDPTVYTYAPSMGNFPGYQYTNDIKLYINSDSEVPFSDIDLEQVDPATPFSYEKKDDHFLINALNRAEGTQGEFRFRTGDNRVSNQTFTIFKTDTLTVAVNTIQSFNDFAPSATDIKYVINDTDITSISQYAVHNHYKTALTWLELIGTSITEIPSGCFKDCGALTTVMLPSSLTKVYKSAFKGVPGPFSFDSDPTSSGNIQFNVEATDSSEASFDINVSGYWNNVEYEWRTNNAWE